MTTLFERIADRADALLDRFRRPEAEPAGELFADPPPTLSRRIAARLEAASEKLGVDALLDRLQPAEPPAEPFAEPTPGRLRTALAAAGRRLGLHRPAAAIDHLADRFRKPEGEPFGDKPEGRFAKLFSREAATVAGSAGVFVSAAMAIGAVIVLQTTPAPAGSLPEPARNPFFAGAVPTIIPTSYASMSPEEAERWNMAMPIDKGPNPAARPFRLTAASMALPAVQAAVAHGPGGAVEPAVARVSTAEQDYARALDCLTAAIHYEAATEGEAGMRAVAQVVLNRVRHPAFPHTVCGVVFQGAELPTGCQFTFTCDGSLMREPQPAAWQAARRIAAEALAGGVFAPVGEATHYHTRWVVPFWAANLSKIGDVGAHIFYKWKGGWGTPAAFNAGYAGGEMDVRTVHGVGKAPFRDEAALTALLITPANVATIQPVAEVAAAPRPQEVAQTPAEAKGSAHTDVAAVLAVAEPPKPIIATPALAPAQAEPEKPTTPFARPAPRVSRIPVPGGRW